MILTMVILYYGINTNYEHVKLHAVVALIMVKMSIQSVLQTVVFSKRKLLYIKIQTMFDQALFLNTNSLFMIVNN